MSASVSVQTTQSGYVKPHRRTPGIGDGLYQFRAVPASPAAVPSPCDRHPDRYAHYADGAVALCRECWSCQQEVIDAGAGT